MKHVITILGIATLFAGMAPAVYAQSATRTDLGREADLFQLGETKRNNGDFKGASEAYTQALQLNSQDTHAYVGRGMVRFELGDKLGAIDDFTQAIQLNPNDAEVYRKRGGIYLILGKKKSARADFQQAAKVTSGSRGNGVSSQTAPSPTFQLQQ